VADMLVEFVVAVIVMVAVPPETFESTQDAGVYPDSLFTCVTESTDTIDESLDEQPTVTGAFSLGTAPQYPPYWSFGYIKSFLDCSPDEKVNPLVGVNIKLGAPYKLKPTLVKTPLCEAMGVDEATQ
jgi:hypothetical protein